MKTMEIIELTNEEMDQLVAQYVMGWMLYENKAWSSFAAQVDDAQSKYWIVPEDKDRMFQASENWNPSNNIFEAFQAWELMEARGWYLKVFQRDKLYNLSQKEWVAEALQDKRGSTAMGETLPRALCQLMLLIVLQEEG